MKWTSFSMTWYLSLRPFDALLSTFFRLFFACSCHTKSARKHHSVDIVAHLLSVKRALWYGHAIVSILKQL